MSIEQDLSRIAVSLDLLINIFNQRANALVNEKSPVTTSPAVPAVPAAPFNTKAEMVQYVMKRYQELGPEKGAGVQTALAGLGVVNIHQVPENLYGALYAALEAL